MPTTSRTLSACVREIPKSIDLSLERLTCTAQNVTEVDIHPAALAALTVSASMEVKSLAAEYQSTVTLREGYGASSSSRLTSSSARQSAGDILCESGNDSQYFNVAIALTLHTVLLSRNRLTSTLGLIQFRNVVRLSLLGNAVRRIEDCEPLGLLPNLAFLSLEFNPVCALPHYRAHLLRITSWPGDLSVRHCRLRKLDGKSVSAGGIAHAAACLQREQAVLPELTQRHRIAAFASHVETTTRLHREMRRRGALLHDTQTSVSLMRLVEWCAPASLVVTDFAAAAHMTRLAAATVGGTLARGCELSAPAVSQAQHGQRQQQQHQQSTSEKANVHVIVQRVAANPANVRNAADSEDAVLPSALEVSVETRTSENGRTIVSVLDEVSEICLEELSWAKLSLINTDQSQHDAVCEEWSDDRLRAALSLLDVQLCTHLLRTARMLGQKLSSRAVDDLCRMWLRHAMQRESSEKENVNVTGPRRKLTATVYTASAAASVSTTTGKHDRRSTPVMEHPHVPSDSPSLQAQGPSADTVVVVMEGSSLTVDSLGQLSAISAGPCEAKAVSRHPTLDAVETVEGRATGPGTTSAPLSARSEIAPRSIVPVATLPPPRLPSPPSPQAEAPLCSTRCEQVVFSHNAGNGAAPPRPGLPPARQEQEMQQQPPIPACHSIDSSPSSGGSIAARSGTYMSKQQRRRKQVTDIDSTNGNTATSALVTSFCQERELQLKQRTMDRLRDACRHRHQSRQCATYRTGRLADSRAELPTLAALGLLRELSYLPRKAVFFQHWRVRAMLQVLAKQLHTRTLLRTWRRHAVDAATMAVMQDAQRSRRAAGVFGLWKARATAAVQRRCREARERLLTSAAAVTAADEKGNGPVGGRSLVWGPRPSQDPQQHCTAEATTSSAGGVSATRFTTSLLHKALSSSPDPKCPSSLGGLSGGSPSPAAAATIESPSPSSVHPPNGGIAVASVVTHELAESFRVVPPPSFEALVKATRDLSRSAARTGAVVMAADAHEMMEPPRRAPSRGLVRSAVVSPSHPIRARSQSHQQQPQHEKQTPQHNQPFSEDDVAALVEKAAALQSGRELLVRRVVELQLACERARVTGSRATTEAAALSEKLNAAQANAAACKAEKARLLQQVEHLKRCVERLRGERREWLSQALNRRNDTIETLAGA